MVEKCANPACGATFHRLGEGRLFIKQVWGDPHYIKQVWGDPRDGRGRLLQPRYLWLCDSCCRTMTVVSERGQKIKVAPLPAVRDFPFQPSSQKNCSRESS